MIDYEFIRIKSKKGNDLLIFDLKSYVEDQIKEGNYKEDKHDYQVTCPYCATAHEHDKSYDGPYLKYKLYVYKDLHFGKCFRCNQYFINNEESLDFEIPYPIDGSWKNLDYKVAKLSGDQWNLELFDSFEPYSEKGMEYLSKKRHHYFKSLQKALNIKFTNDNPVIPFYFRGELIYYQIKLAFGNSRIPYFSPPIEYKPLYMLEHGDNKNFIICEGVFDAISLLIQAPNYTPCAVLGSSITDYQLWMLRSFIPEKIIVYMDNTELSIKLANRVRSVINYAEVDIIPSSGQDPEENLKARMAEELNLDWIK